MPKSWNSTFRRIIIGIAVGSLPQGCAPSDPFERMLWETGFDEDSGIMGIYHPDGTKIAENCSKLIYKGPETNEKVIEGTFSKPFIVNKKIPENYTGTRLKNIFPVLSSYNSKVNGFIPNTTAKEVAREIVGSFGLPRYAYSGNIFACHSIITLIYAGKDFPEPKYPELSGIYKGSNMSCRDPFIAMNISRSGSSVHISWNQIEKEC